MMKIALASAVAAVSLFAAGAPADAHGFKRDNPYGHHHYKAQKRTKAFYKYKQRKARPSIATRRRSRPSAASASASSSSTATGTASGTTATAATADLCYFRANAPPGYSPAGRLCPCGRAAALRPGPGTT